MVTLSINNKAVTAQEGDTILAAATSVGIAIPTLCYLEGVNEIGACRVCMVEVQGLDRLVPACNTPVEEGLVIFTNSPKVRRTRKVNIDLLLSRHDGQCVTCGRNGNCALQSLAGDLGIVERVYRNDIVSPTWDKSFPLNKDMGKCVQCMRCIQVCDNIQALYVWDLVSFGSHIDVDVRGNKKIHESDCALCGQCITRCPVGALSARNDTKKVFDVLADPEITTVVQVAPAVRTAWGEQLGLSREEATPGKMVAALRHIGFDYVFDTTFTADLTVMEEGNEFLERMIHVQEKPRYPLFTSCCPGWVRFIKSQYPDMVGSLSTAKSPQQMFGAVAKSYFAEAKNIDPRKMFVVSIMPCVAKKHEADLPSMNSAGAGQDVDVVLTTREFVRLLRFEHINIAALQEEAFDDPLGEATGAGVIFGITGGVMEAALRTVYTVATGEKPSSDVFKEIRGMQGWKSAEIDVAGKTVRVAVVSGLGNTRKLMDAIRSGVAQYDFVEVMACPGGCAGGGGQPIVPGKELAEVRGDTLFTLDAASTLRYSHENPSVQALYDNYLGKPLSDKAHHLLHSDHSDWSMPHR